MKKEELKWKKKHKFEAETGETEIYIENCKTWFKISLKKMCLKKSKKYKYIHMPFCHLIT